MTCVACSKSENDCDCEAPFCKECGKPCKVSWEDFGIGGYEFWGFCGTHTDIRPVSDCCECDLFEDAELTKPYHAEKEEPEWEPN